MTRAGMTSDEFAAARETLGLSIDDIAAELNLPPHSVTAMETGAIRIPPRIAKDLAYRVALSKRRAVLAQSGLPECPTAAALERAASDSEGESAVALFEKLIAHSASCPACKARSEYLERHAPVLPEYPMPAWIRVIGWIDQRLNRMPRFLRPPEGDAGEGRRVGVFTAAGFSLLAIGIAVFTAISGGMHHVSETGWWRQLLAIGIVVPIAYFVGFYLAGWGFDVTRRLRHRFVGYVARGTLAATAIYGSIGIVMPLLDGDFGWREWPVVVSVLAIVGALGGGILWIVHRVRGKLPSRVAPTNMES